MDAELTGATSEARRRLVFALLSELGTLGSTAPQAINFLFREFWSVKDIAFFYDASMRNVQRAMNQPGAPRRYIDPLNNKRFLFKAEDVRAWYAASLREAVTNGATNRQL